MRKYFKWILLAIFIIFLIITVFLFLDFLEKSTAEEQKKNNFAQLLGINFLRTGVSYYKDGNLIDENLELIDSRYITFNEEYVEFCNPMNLDKSNICEKFNYYYENDLIYFDSSDYFVVKGEYYLEYTENGFSLIYEKGKEKAVYHFSKPNG